MNKDNIDSSFRCIFNIAIPLILSVFSVNLMYFVDRAMLAGYSIDAMNGSIMAGNFVAIFAWFFVGISSSAEVYVGQYNGSKQYDKVSSPIWQMIYMSAFSMILFVIMGYFSESLNFLPDHCKKHGLDYQTPLLYFGFIPALNAGISAFFIGLGKTKVVTIIVVISNILNISLDYIFIYNLDLGCKGASYATVIAELLQTISLFALFFRRYNREKYQTFKNRKANKELFLGCCKIGIPQSISNLMSIISWYLICMIIGYKSKTLSITLGISMNIHILFSFLSEALNKAVALISSNMIGQRDLKSIKIVFKKFIIFTMFLLSIISIPLLFFPEIIFNLFDLLKEDISGLYSEIKSIFALVIANIAIENITFIVWGILVSGGDARYPLIVTQSTFFTFVIIPIIIMYYTNNLDSVSTIFWCTLIHHVVSFIILYKRYMSLKWYNLLVED